MRAAKDLVARALAFALAVGCVAAAEPEEAQGKPDWFSLRDWRGSLSLEGSWAAYNRNYGRIAVAGEQPPQPDRIRSDDREIREILRLGAGGDMLGSEVFRFDGDVGLVLEQGWDSVRTPRTDERTDRVNMLGEYDVRGWLFEKREVALDFLARKERTSVFPDYGDVQDVNDEDYEATLRLRRGPVPVELKYAYSYTEETERGLGLSTDQILSTASCTARHQEGPSRSRVTYSHRDGSYKTADLSEYDPATYRLLTHEQRAELQNELRLDDEKGRLDTGVRYEDETGSYDLGRFYWDELLSLRHAPGVKSEYEAHYADVRSETDDTQTGALAGRLEYQPDSDLRAAGGLRGAHESYTSGRLQTAGAMADMEYQRSIPHGRVWTTIGGSFDFNDQKNDAEGLRSVVDEQVRMEDGYTSFLANLDVDPESIRVFNRSRTVLLTEDVDYQIVQEGRRTEIRRIPGGAVSSPSYVSVDYTYSAGGTYTYSHGVLRASARANLFEYFTFYGQVERTDQNTLSGDDDGRLEDSTSALAGFEAAYEGLSFTAEREWYRAKSNTSYDSTRAAVSAGGNFQRYHSYSATAQWRHMTFWHESRTRYLSLWGRYGFRPTHDLQFDVRAGVIDRDNSDSDERWLFAEGTLKYVFRKSEASLTARHNSKGGSLEDERGDYVFLGLMRSF